MWTAMRHAETRLGFTVKFSFGTAANCILLLVWAIVGANPLSAQAYVSVQVSNLTHPDLAPSFVAGDAYQYIVSGPPNQPVYNVQNSGPMTQVGQTDSNGTYVASGVGGELYPNVVRRQRSGHSQFEFHSQRCCRGRA